MTSRLLFQNITTTTNRDGIMTKIRRKKRKELLIKHRAQRLTQFSLTGRIENPNFERLLVFQQNSRKNTHRNLNKNLYLSYSYRKVDIAKFSLNGLKYIVTSTAEIKKYTIGFYTCHNCDALF